MTTRLAFDVEQAGCPSCAARIRAVLDPLARLDEITIDEEAAERSRPGRLRMRDQMAAGAGVEVESTEAYAVALLDGL